MPGEVGHSEPSDVLDSAREMALLASVEAGTPEDCADAAMRVLLEHLLDFAGPARYNDVELDAQYVEGLMKRLDPNYRGAHDD